MPPNRGVMDPLDALFGGGGGSDADLRALLESSYDDQIAAYQAAGDEMARLTQGLISNIHSSRDATNEQIGGFFDYAAGQAEAGRPVIAETGQTAHDNVDAIYDTLASRLGGMPQQGVDRASAAAGSAVGQSVADRISAATAPFQAAGETSRANTQANLATHTTAGQDYLSQLAAAAPSEAAQNQAAVSGRAAQAVTEAEMALAQQRAEMAAQTAALEGAKQRALIEQSADVAGSTMDRMMQTAQLYDALGADKSDLLASLGLQPASEMEEMSLKEMIDLETAHARLGNLTDPMAIGGDRGFDAALAGADPSTQRVGRALRSYAESLGDGFSLGHMEELLGGGGPWGGEEIRELLSELLPGENQDLWFDSDVLQDAFRAWVQ